MDSAQMRLALLALPGADEAALDAALTRCQAGDNAVEPLPEASPHRPPATPHYQDLGFLDYLELGAPYADALEQLARAGEPCALLETATGPVILRRMVHYDAQPWGEGQAAAAREHTSRRRATKQLLEEVIPGVIRDAGLDPSAGASSAPPGLADTVPIAGGLFWMGSTPEEIDQRVDLYDRYVAAAVGPAQRRRYEDEVLHPVLVADFAIDRTEVTEAAFRAFVDRSGYRYEGASTASRDEPVNEVSLADAMAFCLERGARLPTAEEWEYAARGPAGRRFPWGDELPDGQRGNFCDRRCDQPWATPDHDDGHAGLAPVGSYPAGATPEGVLDLSGNVREWTSMVTGEGKAWIKGGGHRNAYDDMIPADVRVQDWNRRSPDVGFRCVVDGD